MFADSTASTRTPCRVRDKRVAATVDLGRHPPTALLVAGDDVWVIAADGSALFVQTRDD